MMYEFDGENHYMSAEEAAAIQRTGPSHRVQDYAMGMHLRGHANREPLGKTLRDVGCRPGTTNGGGLQGQERPVDATVQTVARVNYKVHLSGAPCTLTKRQAFAIDDIAFRRKHAITPGLVCKTCVRIMNRIS